MIFDKKKYYSLINLLSFQKYFVLFLFIIFFIFISFIFSYIYNFNFYILGLLGFFVGLLVGNLFVIKLDIKICEMKMKLDLYNKFFNN